MSNPIVLKQGVNDFYGRGGGLKLEKRKKNSCPERAVSTYRPIGIDPCATLFNVHRRFSAGMSYIPQAAAAAATVE